MIPRDKVLKLIKIYMYVCKQYDENLKHYCQRYSNNSVLVFTDQEILTIYLFVGSEQRSRKSNEHLTSLKAIKGVSEDGRQRNKAADDLYSAAVSSVREPVEAFFSWLSEKTNIQRANKCRSTAGLLIHTLGKLAIAFIFLIFNY